MADEEPKDPEDTPEKASEEKPDKVREWSLAVGIMFVLALMFWSLFKYMQSLRGI